MARVTVAELQERLEAKEAEIARLNALLLSAREQLNDHAAALRLIGTIVQDGARR